MRGSSMGRSCGVVLVGAMGALGGTIGDAAASELKAPVAADLLTGHWEIRSGVEGACLEVEGASASPGAKINTGPCSGGDHQKVEFVQGPGYTYRIRFKHSGLYLAVPENSDKPGWKLVQWTSTTGAEQRFSVVELGHALFSLKTQRGMVLTTIYQQARMTLTQDTAKGVDPGGATFRLSRGEALNLTQGYHRIHDLGYRECLEVPGASHSAGKRIVNWPCNFTDQQKLKFEDAGDGWYRIRFKHSGLYVAVPDNSSKGNWRLVQWSATGAEDQQFRIQPNGAGTYNIWTRRGKVLTISSHEDCPKAIWDGLCERDEYLTQHGENEQSSSSARFWFDRVDVEDPTDFGYADRRWMMDHDGDGKDDFCRAVGNSSGAGSYLGCSRSTDTGIGGAITTHVPIADWGHAGRRWMVDFNGDGKDDFCRAVGNSGGTESWLGCSPSNGTGLSGTIDAWKKVPIWGPEGLRFMADVKGQGRAELVFQSPYHGSVLLHTAPM